MKNKPTLPKTILLLLSVSFLFMSSCEKQECEIENTKTLDFLLGNWTRLESNNPTADGMRINVAGTQGTLVDPAGSNYNQGDIKWADITPETMESYTHQELGSDNNYYDATILIINDTTIEISVVSTGAGNSQIWTRGARLADGGGTGPNETVTIDCSVNTETTLFNGPADVDYRVSCVVDITAKLTIEPGVVIEFEENSGLGVYGQGSLNAVGTTTLPVVFRGVEDIQGYWRGVHIETKSFNNELEYVSIENAGSNYVYCCNVAASLFLKGASIDLDNVTINNGAGYGFYADVNAKLRSFSKILVSNNEDYLGYLHLERASEMPANSITSSNNDQDYVFIYSSQVNDAITIHDQGIPYLFEGKVFDIVDRFTIENGVEILFKEGGGIGVYDEGSLEIKGTTTSPVSIKGLQNVSGFWRGIHIETNSIYNNIQYLNLSDAGSNYVYCCNIFASIFLKNGSAKIENSTVSNGAGYGIATGNNFSFASAGFSQNVVTSHVNYPLYISVEQADAIDGMSSDFSGNQKDYINIYNTDLNNGTTVTFEKTNVPYLIENGAVIDVKNGELKFDPGSEIVFDVNSGIGVYDSGVINAEGTSTERIIIRGLLNSKGYWRGIHVETNNPGNHFNYCDISDAGSNYVYCCNTIAAVFLKTGLLTVENTNISNTGGCAIYARTDATLSDSGNVFTNNDNNGVCTN